MKTNEVNQTLFLQDELLSRSFLSSGALLFFKPKSPIGIWNYMTLDGSYQDKKVLEDALSAVACDKWKGHYFSPGTKLLLLDSDGNIMLRNCEVSVKKDENNFIHIYEPKTNFYLFVKAFPIKDCPEKVIFVVTEDVSKLNKRIASLVSKKLINKPSDFSLKTGLKKLPIFQTPEQFDKE